MSGTAHKHPTFGVCTCGHLDFMHPWTTYERVNYPGACIAADMRFYADDPAPAPCECKVFHADPLTVKEETA